MNVQTMALDVSKETEAQSTITIRQGDKNGTVLNVGIFDNGTALDLSSLSVRLCAKLPDGVHYYSVNGTASGNTATFGVDESYAAAYPGVTDLAYVDVLDGDDVICSTQPFRLVVEPGAREGVVPSDEHISEIDAAVERANEAARECEELAYPITTSQIDSIVADTSVTSTNKLSATGLTYFWGKLKTWAASAFAAISHTHADASSTAAGFMSASEHDKLDGIEAGAEVNDVTGVKGDSESTYRTGNVSLTAANVGAAAASHNHSGDALTPASVAATGAVSGSSISDGTGTLAQLRESVSQLIKIVSVTLTQAVAAGAVTQFSQNFTVPSGYTALFAVARSSGVGTTVSGGCYFPSGTSVSASVYAVATMTNCTVRFDVFCVLDL